MKTDLEKQLSNSYKEIEKLKTKINSQFENRYFKHKYRNANGGYYIQGVWVMEYVGSNEFKLFTVSADIPMAGVEIRCTNSSLELDPIYEIAREEFIIIRDEALTKLREIKI
jgi:hypothetical protein